MTLIVWPGPTPAGQTIVSWAPDGVMIANCWPAATPAGTVIQGVGITPESKLPGPAVPFGPLPLPSAAAFDEAWDARVCPKPQTEARI